MQKMLTKESRYTTLPYKKQISNDDAAPTCCTELKNLFGSKPMLIAQGLGSGLSVGYSVVMLPGVNWLSMGINDYIATGVGVLAVVWTVSFATNVCIQHFCGDSQVSDEEEQTLFYETKPFYHSGLTQSTMNNQQESNSDNINHTYTIVSKNDQSLIDEDEENSDQDEFIPLPPNNRNILNIKQLPKKKSRTNLTQLQDNKLDLDSNSSANNFSENFDNAALHRYGYNSSNILKAGSQ